MLTFQGNKFGISLNYPLCSLRFVEHFAEIKNFHKKMETDFMHSFLLL